MNQGPQWNQYAVPRSAVFVLVFYSYLEIYDLSAMQMEHVGHWMLSNWLHFWRANGSCFYWNSSLETLAATAIDWCWNSEDYPTAPCKCFTGKSSLSYWYCCWCCSGECFAAYHEITVTIGCQCYYLRFSFHVWTCTYRGLSSTKVSCFSIISTSQRQG